MPKRKTFSRLAARLRDRLQVLIERKLTVTINASSKVWIHVSRELKTIRVAVHRVFVDAPDEIIVKLALYIDTDDAEASRALDQFIEQVEEAGYQSRSPRPLKTTGAVHDLQARFDALNARYFSGKIQARISWGAPVRSQTSIRVGSYTVQDQLIRVSPVLDRAFVPEWFVDWVIFHEMLHEIYPPVRAKRRWDFHPPQLREHERKFPNWDLAREWLLNNIDRLFAP